MNYELLDEILDEMSSEAVGMMLDEVATISYKGHIMGVVIATISGSRLW